MAAGIRAALDLVEALRDDFAGNAGELPELLANQLIGVAPDLDNLVNIKDYRSALRDRTPPPEIQQVVSTIVTREEEHVRQLDRLIAFA